MPTTFCLLNHQLTEKQCKELSEKMDSSGVIFPPPDISLLWEQLPVTPMVEKETVERITSWLNSADAVSGDYLIVQGEFGYTFAIVDYALKKGFVPLHAVTKRVEQEEREGEIIRRHYIFEHVCFRRYEYFDACVAPVSDA